MQAILNVHAGRRFPTPALLFGAFEMAPSGILRKRAVESIQT